MDFALTFGSLGDIIQLCQLAIQLGRAIGVGTAAVNGSSAKEYQQLRHDLDLFVGVLMQVVATFQQHEITPSLQVLDSVSKSVVENCRTLIQDTLDHLQSRYDCSLTKEGSGNKARDVLKRVEWCLREKDRLRAIHDGLQDAVQRLALLSSLSARKSARVNNATLVARVDLVLQMCKDRHQQILSLFEEQKIKIDAHFDAQKEKLSHIQNQLGTVENTSRTITSIAGDTLQSILEVKEVVLSTSQAVINLQISASQAQCMRSLDPTKELSVILEDALGRQIPIPAQWLDTLEWNTLNVLLVGYFQGKKGQDMIRRGEYALEDGHSGSDIDSDMPLNQILRRGMKINMSMVFLEKTLVAGCCPRCHAFTDALEGVSIQCPVPDCGMWFRMQKLMIGNATLRPASQCAADQPDKLLPTKNKSVVTSTPAAPGDFLRVRLLHIHEQHVVSNQIKKDNSDESLSGSIHRSLLGVDSNVASERIPHDEASRSHQAVVQSSASKTYRRARHQGLNNDSRRRRILVGSLTVQSAPSPTSHLSLPLLSTGGSLPHKSNDRLYFANEPVCVLVELQPAQPLLAATFQAAISLVRTTIGYY